MAVRFIVLFPLLLTSQLFVVSVMSRTFTIENNCQDTIWPASYSYAGSVNETGFALERGEKRIINSSSSWIGHFWGRTLCTTNSTGAFSCVTGDCNSGKLECSSTSELMAPLTIAEFPATLAEFNLGRNDYYDVNIVNGYNLPLRVTPENKNCESIGCVVELNNTCPVELTMRSVDINSNRPYACNTSCQVSQAPEVCCVGLYVLDKDVVPPERCTRTNYSEAFNKACPRAYSYVYDSNISTFRCSYSSNFVITFCPLPDGTPPGKFPLKLALSLGVSSVLGLIIIIIAIMLKVRANNRRKSDWDDKNIDAVVMLKRFSYVQVKKMTKSFADVLGKGGYGIVYKGKLLDGSREVAVKILKDSNGSGEEFINELASMSRTSHVNIVPLLGFCYERNKKAIIYEFMPNGSLDKFISEKMSTKMEWKTLYNIAVGMARGLDYLHNRCVTRIVHFDIKPQNILIDGDSCPKIADFGLAKLSKNNESIMSMLDTRGTAGYIAPEVFSKKFGGVSHKSDVYSYGMVILEMIGAKNVEKAQDAGSNNSSMYFPDWIYKDLVDGEIMSFFADHITEEEDEKMVKQMVLVGLWCIQTNPLDRPPMSKVVEMLEGSLEALETPPEPLLCLPARTVQKTDDEIQESSSFSKLSQDTSHYAEQEVQDIAKVNQESLRSS